MQYCTEIHLNKNFCLKEIKHIFLEIRKVCKQIFSHSLSSQSAASTFSAVSTDGISCLMLLNQGHGHFERFQAVEWWRVGNGSSLPCHPLSSSHVDSKRVHCL